MIETGIKRGLNKGSHWENMSPEVRITGNTRNGEGMVGPWVKDLWVCSATWVVEKEMALIGIKVDPG